MEATKDENAVIFSHEQSPAFAELRDIIHHRISQPERSATAVGSSANDLATLSVLYEKGHLSAEEFTEAKKRFFAGQPSVPIYKQQVSQSYKPTASVKKRGRGFPEGFLFLWR